MQPYQRASEAIRSGEEYPIHVLKNAGLTALGGGAATLGSKAIAGILPAVGALINKHVPENIARAGLSKIDPRLGKFLEGATEAGYGFDDLREFFGEKLEKSAKDSGNVIKQYSPELHQFIEAEIQKGRSPDEAGAMAQLKPEFKKHIEKLSKDHKAPFSALLKTVYGEGKKAEATRQYNARNQQKQTMMQQEEERFNQQYGQEQQQQGQGLDPSVAAILQQGQSILQQFKGQA